MYHCRAQQTFCPDVRSYKMHQDALFSVLEKKTKCSAKLFTDTIFMRNVLHFRHISQKAFSSRLNLDLADFLRIETKWKLHCENFGYFQVISFHKGLLVGSDYRKNLSMALLVSRDLYNMCHVTPGGPWKGFSCHAW